MKAFACKEEHAEILEITRSLADLKIHSVLAGMEQGTRVSGLSHHVSFDERMTKMW